MSNFETGKPAPHERADGVEDVSARLEKIKSMQIGDLSPEELMLLAGERQALAERKEEAAMDRTYEEALGDNAEYDAKKTAEKEAQEKQKEEDRAQEQEDKDKAAQIVEQLKGEGTGAENSEESKVRQARVTVLNNQIVSGEGMSDSRKRAEAIKNLSESQIEDVIGVIKSYSGTFKVQYAFLNNFEFDPRIVTSPEMVAVYKGMLQSEPHLYDVDRILSIPSFPKEILDDPEVRLSIIRSEADFLKRQAGQAGEDFSFTRRIQREVAFSADEKQILKELIKNDNTINSGKKIEIYRWLG